MTFCHFLFLYIHLKKIGHFRLLEVLISGLEGVGTRGRKKLSLSFYKPHEQWDLVEPIFLTLSERQALEKI